MLNCFFAIAVLNTQPKNGSETVELLSGGDNMAEELLINQLFAGRYLDEGENIGHEVINLFKDDEGNNNLFITPSGQVKDHEVKNILFVRNISSRTTVEVICLAKVVSTIDDEEIKKIRYAGFSLEQIFSSNTYHGDIDTVTQHVTFRSKQISIPLNRIFITLDENFKFDGDATVIYLKSERKVIIPQGMREYYSEKNDAKAYQQLTNDLIGNKSIWNETNTTNVLIPDGVAHNQPPSFLEVIRKEDDENIFSNLLSYFFEYSYSSFQKFAKDILEIDDMGASFELVREKAVEKVEDNPSDNPKRRGKERIDIWIESDDDIIVIENKIKSGINSIVNEEHGKQSSQLNSYYAYASEIAEKSQKKVHFYILAPDYAKFDLNHFGDDIRDNFKIINYSEVYNFFVKESATYIADRAFPDFVRGLKRHTLSLSELQFDTMRTRLLRRINQLQ